ncbi:MAG: SseB family protein [Rhodobacter sp.]|nr:SseB family protein [Rhodobacter sp.]
MTETPLDAAHAEMEVGDEAARLRFFDRLTSAELFLLLKSEPDGDRIEPDVFDTEDGRILLAFDREDRLAGFVGRPAPYAALSGRALAEMLAGQGIGLGLNLDVAPSSMLLPPEVIDWLHASLAGRPSEIAERPTELRPPAGLPEAVLTALDAKLATAAGLARTAYLVSVTYAPNRPGHLLAVIDAAPGAEAALAQAVGEALTFSGVEAGEIDIGFFGGTDPMAARLAKVGLRFDLPEPEAHPSGQPPAPGMDPDRPPKLR